MTLKDFSKDFRFWVMILVSILIPPLFYIQTPIELIPNADEFHRLIWGNIWGIMYIFRFFIVFTSCDIISKEFKNNTLLSIMTTPIRKKNIFLGKYLTIFLIITFFETITFFFSIGLSVNLYNFPLSNSTIWVGYCVIILITPVTLAISFMLSLFLRNTIQSFVLHLTYIFLGEPFLRKLNLSNITIRFLMDSQINYLRPKTIDGNTVEFISLFRQIYPELLMPIFLIILSIIVFGQIDLKDK